MGTANVRKDSTYRGTAPEAVSAPRRKYFVSEGGNIIYLSERVYTKLSKGLPARNSQKSPGPTLFAIFAMVSMSAALIAVLMLNIAVSSKQYELVSMRTQEVALMEQNEALNQQLDSLKTPQNLELSATQLNMIPSTTFGTVDVDAMEVTGNPLPEQAPGAIAP